jgi:glyoxylase-like metal-dependent hydrolase (beta-lactamase superfamily II)
MMTRKFVSILVMLLCSASLKAQVSFEREGAAPGNLRFSWIHGSQSAKANTDVRIQVHRYNEHSYILRQNPAVHWEAPFMYLLTGNERAVLLDTGATEEAEYFPLREVIDRVLTRWARAQGVAMPELIVLPLGDDESQTAAMSQFADRPNTRIIPPTEQGRDTLLGAGWGEGSELDLGGRILQVLPTPGLDSASISLYDPWAQLLFTGNAFYPGRLVIRDFAAYRQSLRDLVALAEDKPVQMIFGGRIEMMNRPGLDYRLRANYRPNEHRLQLGSRHLGLALQAVNLINGSTDIRILNDFILMHGVGRGARDYGYPVFMPEQF